jgi:hypothetical protein
MVAKRTGPREVQKEFCGGTLTFNPLVSFLSFAILWGFAIWCMQAPAEAKLTLQDWQEWVTSW